MASKRKKMDRADYDCSGKTKGQMIYIGLRYRRQREKERDGQRQRDRDRDKVYLLIPPRTVV